MPFDTETFQQILSQMAKTTYEIADLYEIRSHRQELAKASFHPHSDPAAGFNLRSFFLGKASNHQRLSYEAFLKDRRNDVLLLRDLLREGIPALDHDSLFFEIILHKKAPKGAQMRMKIMGMDLGGGSNGIQIATLMKKLETAAGRMSALERPAGRVFRIGFDHEIPAADAAAALRVYAAISAPKLFDPKHHAKAGSPSLVEVQDTETPYAALLQA